MKLAPKLVAWAIKADVSDAYHHLRLSDKIGKYFQFEVDGETFQCIGLPFGWSCAPGAFTKFLRPVIAALRSPALTNELAGFQWLRNLTKPFYVGGFLDDLIGLGATYKDTLLLVDNITTLFSDLGILYHPHKCEFTPIQEITYLGMLLDVPNKLFKLTTK